MIPARTWLAFGRGALAFGVLLFGSAGTLAWPAAWAYLALFLGGSLLITWTLARHDPALLEERMKPLIQKDQPVWDRIILSLLAVLWVAWLILMGLDAIRFGWSRMPAWLQWTGAAGVTTSEYLWYRIVRENTFLAGVVRIQTERSHRVVSTGPYAVVRHPLYSSAILFFFATPLMLGSWWGLAGAVALSALIIVRTALEDLELQRRLEGYAGYTHRVRYRLVPGLW